MKIRSIVMSAVITMVLASCSTGPATTTSGSTTSATNTTSPATTAVLTAVVTSPQTAPKTTPLTVALTSPLSTTSSRTLTYEDQTFEDIIGYLELNLGEWFTISVDKELEGFLLDPNVIAKTTFIMLDDSSGPMEEQWEEMKSKILYVSEEIYEVIPEYIIAISNWGDKSDYILFAVQNGEIIDDYLSEDD